MRYIDIKSSCLSAVCYGNSIRPDIQTSAKSIVCNGIGRTITIRSTNRQIRSEIVKSIICGNTCGGIECSRNRFKSFRLMRYIDIKSSCLFIISNRNRAIPRHKFPVKSIVIYFLRGSAIVNGCNSQILLKGVQFISIIYNSRSLCKNCSDTRKNTRTIQRIRKSVIISLPVITYPCDMCKTGKQCCFNLFRQTAFQFLDNASSTNNFVLCFA